MKKLFLYSSVLCFWLGLSDFSFAGENFQSFQNWHHENVVVNRFRNHQTNVNGQINQVISDSDLVNPSRPINASSLQLPPRIMRKDAPPPREVNSIIKFRRQVSFFVDPKTPSLVDFGGVSLSQPLPGSLGGTNRVSFGAIEFEQRSPLSPLRIYTSVEGVRAMPSPRVDAGEPLRFRQP